MSESIYGFPAVSNNQTELPSQLTHNFQIDKVAHHGLRGHLALVQTLVPLLHPLYLQRPIPSLLVVRRLKPLVGRVRVGAHRQNVDVPVPDPGDLFG